MDRIATVKATGKKYIVQQIDFSGKKVMCWGEVCKTKTNVGSGHIHMTHEKHKVFMLDFVEITEVKRTEELAQELFNQFIESVKDRGAQVYSDNTSPRGNRTVRVRF